jgi:uroporphyrinogen-III synthase
MRVVVTRPREDAEQTASALRRRGHDVLVASLMRIEPITADVSGDWRAVVITSTNALRALPDGARAALLSLPLFAIGDRSANAAQELGIVDIHSAGGNSDDLVRLVAAADAHTRAPVLYLAGEDRATDLAHELKMRGVKAEMRIVYRAAALPFPVALIQALTMGEVDAVLHFSKRSAQNYLAAAAAAGIQAPALSVRHFCLSEPISEALAAAGAAHIAVSARADEDALIELLSTLSD